MVSGGCKGKVSNVIAANGGECPDNCFDTPSGQMIMTQGAPGTDWVVGITQCIKVCVAAGRPAEAAAH